MSSTTKWPSFAKSRGATLAAVLLSTSASASTARAATIAVNNSGCTFVKAVTSINNQSTQPGCSRSGTYGFSDTISIPIGNFDITAPVDITRSMTINGGGKIDTVMQTTNSAGAYGLHITATSAVVTINNLTLSGMYYNDTGIQVEGENDTNLSDKNLTLNNVVIANFGNSGIWNIGGRVLIQHTLIYLNYGSWGGGVLTTNGQNRNLSWAVASFTAKNSAISENDAGYGGGIYNTGKMDLRSTLLQVNHATQDGGAIYVNSASPPNSSCNLARDGSGPPTEIDQSQVDYGGYGIISTTIPCTMNDTIGSQNSYPYCSSLATPCPQ